MNALKKLLFGFKYAFKGVLFCIKTCRNFRIHTVAVLVVLYFSRFYQLSKTDYAILLVLFGLVLTSEAVNSAIEQCCNEVSVNYSERIKFAKDAAAGAVLITALTALCVAIVMFWDVSVFKEIANYFSHSVIRCLLLALSVLISVIYIFSGDIFKNGKQ